MPDPCRHEGPLVLLVEGKNDCHVVLALCQHFNIPETFGVHQCENDTGVLDRLDALIPAPGIRVVGVVLDADDVPAGERRWRQIAEILAPYHYPLPETPAPGGTILSMPGKPKVGVWLMPDNVQQGRLEDFLLAMTPPESMNCARACVDEAKQKGHATFKASHRSKADIHTYLAWQDEPGMPLGRSITALALRPDTPTALGFKEWIGTLFATP